MARSRRRTGKMPDYRSMTGEELREAYRHTFGAEFMEDHSQGGARDAELLACLEEGKPQDVETFIASLPRWPA